MAWTKVAAVSPSFSISMHFARTAANAAREISKETETVFGLCWTDSEARVAVSGAEKACSL